MCGEGGGRERLAGLLSGYKRLPPEFIGKRTLRPSAAERSTFRHCWYYAVGVCSLLHSLLSHIHATGKHSAREYSAQRRESKLAGTSVHLADDWGRSKSLLSPTLRLLFFLDFGWTTFGSRVDSHSPFSLPLSCVFKSFESIVNKATKSR
jgi:hypothetical protein